MNWRNSIGAVFQTRERIVERWLETKEENRESRTSAIQDLRSREDARSGQISLALLIYEDKWTERWQPSRIVHFTAFLWSASLWYHYLFRPLPPSFEASSLSYLPSLPLAFFLLLLLWQVGYVLSQEEITSGSRQRTWITEIGQLWTLIQLGCATALV